MIGSAPTPLDPLTIPLQGTALIEASAGTGKTYTLALLYLRLVLGLEPDHPLADRRDPPPLAILVVTFTRAATRELRDRIRQRLVEAASLLRGKGGGDKHLLDLRDQIPVEQQAAAAMRLEVAAAWMDEAAISTIHSWCYRMLQEHAFDSGQGFDLTLFESNQEQELLQQVCEDYWRLYYLPLSVEQLRLVRTHIVSPSALRVQIKGYLNYLEWLDAPPAATADLATQITQCQADYRASLQQIKGAIGPAVAQLIADYQGLFALPQKERTKRFNGRSLQWRFCAPIFTELQRWAGSDDQVPPAIEFHSNSFVNFTLQNPDVWKDPAWPIPIDRDAAETVAALPTQLDALPSLYVTLFYHACQQVHWRFEQEKRRQRMMSNDDLLYRLDQALQSPQGGALAAAIRRRYPIALVDEFQDTDPIQYRIFHTIYQLNRAHSAPDIRRHRYAFFMIGDPKQAIYAFRSADIYTYLQARHQSHHQYTLSHNYRAESRLIDAVNQLFEQAEKRSKGAFRLGNSATGAANPLQFQRVESGNEQALRLYVDGKTCHPQQCWLYDVGADGANYRSTMSRAAADQVARLLYLGQQRRALLIPANVRFDSAAPPAAARPLQPSDLAILVNSASEAVAVREALFARGVPSVYLSDRSSVYAGEEARELLLLLTAIEQPLADRQLRRALATTLCGWQLTELERLQQDQRFLDQQIDQMVQWRQIWQQQGVLPLVHHLIHFYAVAPRWQQQSGGERRLTDLLHLAELLQQAAQQLDGEAALLRFLQQAIAQPNEQGDGQRQRLESDAALVKVVTIHAAKGLQYPLVLLPFASFGRKVTLGDGPIKYHTHDADGRSRLKLPLQPNELDQQQADEERLAEDIRKLYVALTRAICGNWIGIDTTKSRKKPSAIDWLLNCDGDAAIDPRVIAQLQPTALEIVPLPPPLTDDERYEQPQPSRWRPARALSVRLTFEPWWIASYSAFQYGAMIGGEPDIATAQQDQRHEAFQLESLSSLEGRGELKSVVIDASVVSDASVANGTSGGLLHQLPRGSEIGTFIHGVLEWAAEQSCHHQGVFLEGFAAAAADDTLRQQMLQARCRRRQLQPLIGSLDRWLQQFLRQRWYLSGLPPAADGTPVSFALVDLPPSQIAVEMEFLFASAALSTTEIDQWVRRYCWPGKQRPAAQPIQLAGMLKGFIDLVAVISGRYYVIDWKSNYLGADDAAYDHASLLQALLYKRYDLQYVIYLLALHRLLQSRLADYDYDRDIGGAIYFFLRGSCHPDTQGLLMERPPRQLIEQLDRLFREGDQAAAAPLTAAVDEG